MSAYQSTEAILKKTADTVTADAKADTDPGAVTVDDLANMSPDRLRAFLNSGAASHLGIGAPRSSRRR